MATALGGHAKQLGVQGKENAGHVAAAHSDRLVREKFEDMSAQSRGHGTRRRMPILSGNELAGQLFINNQQEEHR
jgi:hypothetical protein